MNISPIGSIIEKPNKKNIDRFIHLAPDRVDFMGISMNLLEASIAMRTIHRMRLHAERDNYPAAYNTLRMWFPKIK